MADERLSRGVLMHLGMDMGLAVGQEDAAVRNLRNVMAGAEPTTVPVQIQTAVTDTVTQIFSPPNNQRLVTMGPTASPLTTTRGCPPP